MDNNNIERTFKEAADQGFEKMAPHMWERLELKLDHKAQTKEIRSYKLLFRMLAVACFTTLMVSIFLLNRSDDYDPQLIAYAPGAGLTMEELRAEDSDFYNLEKLETLQEAYKKLQSNQIR